MKPAPMTDEQIKTEAMDAFDCTWDADDETLVNKYGHGVYLYHFLDFAQAIIAARDAQWEQMLKDVPETNFGNMAGKVYDITDATPPEPETGFSLLGELM